MFMSFTNFYRCFIKSVNRIAALLISMLKTIMTRLINVTSTINKMSYKEEKKIRRNKSKKSNKLFILFCSTSVYPIQPNIHPNANIIQLYYEMSYPY